MNNSPLIIQEQGELMLDTDSSERSELLSILNKDIYSPSDPDRLLGLDWSNRSQTRVKAKFYVGLKWVKEREYAIYVKPKIPHLDFMSMFMHCFNDDNQELVNKLGKIYNIDFDGKPINVESDCIELTPLLIVHFLKLAQRIVQKGLKNDFIRTEDNFRGKIKGKVLLSQTIKRNYSSGRADRIICRYQDYSLDCFENRVLKKALLFVKRFIEINPDISCREDLNHIVIYCLGAMTSVTDEVPLQQIKQFKLNSLYKEYAEALRVARLILRRFSYNIDFVKQNVDRALPPFWIDMSLLFELYVYSLLKKAYDHQICYHLSTSGNEIDFVKYDENLIIDTKYIPQWQDRILHDNVRQLSGYARNIALRKKILKKDDDQTTILDCLIIYPSNNGRLRFDSNEKLIHDKTFLNTYLKFHKLAVKLPTRGESK